MKKIGFNEEFTLFILIDFKDVDNMMAALKDAGFEPKVYNIYGNDSKSVEVTVTPFTAASAHTIMDNNK